MPWSTAGMAIFRNGAKPLMAFHRQHLSPILTMLHREVNTAERMHLEHTLAVGSCNGLHVYQRLVECRDGLRIFGRIRIGVRHIVSIHS